MARWVQVGPVRLHARDHGDPGAPPVLVLHGLMGHAREWDALTAVLAERFRVIAIDLRGHGQSDWAREYTAAQMASDTAELFGRLGLTRVRVVGHSMGGMAAMLLSAKHRALVEQLVVVDVGPESLEGTFAAGLPGMLRALAKARYESIEEAVAQWKGGDALAREQLLRHYLEHCLVADADGRLRYRFDGEGLVQFVEQGVEPAELWAAAEAIACPTLLIRGELSAVLPAASARELAARIRSCELVTISGAGHDLGVQRPEAVAAAALKLFGMARERAAPSASPL